MASDLRTIRHTVGVGRRPANRELRWKIDALPDPTHRDRNPVSAGPVERRRTGVAIREADHRTVRVTVAARRPAARMIAAGRATARTVALRNRAGRVVATRGAATTDRECAPTGGQKSSR